ncbi:hypothetical protein AWL63_19205 [Sphingomonas panacis]|uniref:AlpA family transcriptional regulator n=2 Tax=Sphingomonas panacis TaxID=1560345 RepID=A0A1B3ZE93_9SPHN|nr:hypothetical protein AWL63_19205 [Sphingomonas panacis]
MTSPSQSRPQTGRFLRMPDVVEATGLSSATINRLHRRNEFPAKRQLSERCVGWWEQDIAAWKASRPDVREK